MDFLHCPVFYFYITKPNVGLQLQIFPKLYRDVFFFFLFRKPAIRETKLALKLHCLGAAINALSTSSMQEELTKYPCVILQCANLLMSAWNAEANVKLLTIRTTRS